MGHAARLTCSLGLFLWLASVAAQAAPSWTVDPASSRLGFRATQAGAEFEGRFTRFGADIRFDEQDLASSRFEVEVRTGSADTGEARRDGILTGPEFFWSERYPVATFEALDFSVSDTDYLARGTLTLRGVSRPVEVRFRFERTPEGGARLTGRATLRRLEFGVGQGEWASTEWVGDEVGVGFDLGLSR